MSDRLEMTVTPSGEVFGEVERYLRHETTLHDLHQWMARHTGWTMTAPRDDGTQLAGLIELDLAEIAHGHATEEDLYDDLLQFLASHKRLYLNLSGGDCTGSSSAVVSSELVFRMITDSVGPPRPGRTGDTQHAVVSW